MHNDHHISAGGVPADAPSVEPIAIIGLACRVPGAADAAEFWREPGRRRGVGPLLHPRGAAGASACPPGRWTSPNFVSAAPVLDAHGRVRRRTVRDDAPRGGADATRSTGCSWSWPHRAGGRRLRPARATRARSASTAGAGHRRLPVAATCAATAQVWSGAGGQLAVTVANPPDYVATSASYKLDLRGPSLTRAHRLLHVAGRGAPGLRGAAQRRVRHGAGRRRHHRAPARRAATSYDGAASPRPTATAARSTPPPRARCGAAAAASCVLKRLADALADGDHVRAVVLGNAINNDGAAKVGFSAPSVGGPGGGHRAGAGVRRGRPAHGQLRRGARHRHRARRPDRGRRARPASTAAHHEDRQWCGIGSVKANIGHLSQAAGVAGLIKAVLALEHGIIPPEPALRDAQPADRLRATARSTWSATADRLGAATATPPRAGVSSFGIGGTNAHVVLEEAPAADAPRAPSRPRRTLLQLSAAHRRRAGAPRRTTSPRHLERNPDLDLADVAYTLRVGRTRASAPARWSWRATRPTRRRRCATRSGGCTGEAAGAPPGGVPVPRAGRPVRRDGRRSCTAPSRCSARRRPCAELPGRTSATTSAPLLVRTGDEARRPAAPDRVDPAGAVHRRVRARPSCGAAGASRPRR